MKIHEVPELLKIYTMKVTGGSSFQVNGEQKLNIMDSPSQFVQLQNGDTINKSFIIEFKLDFEATRENVVKNQNSITKV